ncbi:MAG: Ubiquinone/menaquinone biosynthesis C-methylase UbiE [Actinomycetia bacterium]|nr:Ubiquinone/menaquinone biosynthesis C-methylase UbiE [Actinomycetes bacterium]
MSKDQRQQVAALFDRAAVTYDDVGVELFQPIARRLVAELDPLPGERALDIGCGRGAALFPLARAVGPDATVVGIDLALSMVSTTAADASRLGLTCDVRLGDAQHPDLDPASFDVIASSLVLFFLPDPGAALEAWRALLVDGGRVGISTFGDHSASWKAVDAVFTPFLPPQMADPRTQGEASPFATDAGVEQLLSHAGFGDVRTTTMTLPVRFDDEDHWYRWTWSTGQRRMWESIPAEQHAATRAAAYEQLDRCRDGDGRIGFDQDVRFTLGRR